MVFIIYVFFSETVNPRYT